MNQEPIKFLRQHGEHRYSSVEKEVMRIMGTIPDSKDQLFMCGFQACLLEQVNHHRSNARKWGILALSWSILGALVIGIEVYQQLL